MAAGKSGPVRKPKMETVTAETTNFGTSQKTSWTATDRARYPATARRSPIEL